MTYRRDSDAFAPYGTTVPKPNANWFNFSELETKFKSKSRPIAWLVNNCNANSNREFYVEKLKNFIDVDIFGNCGNFKCPREEWGFQPCWGEIEAKYYFYLSFESNICRDECVNFSFSAKKKEKKIRKFENQKIPKNNIFLLNLIQNNHDHKSKWDFKF